MAVENGVHKHISTKKGLVVKLPFAAAELCSKTLIRLTLAVLKYCCGYQITSKKFSLITSILNGLKILYFFELSMYII